MSKFTKLMQFATAGSTEKKKLMKKPSFQKTVLTDLNEDQKELLISDAKYESKLIQTEVYDTIVDGQQLATGVRDLVPVINTDSNQVRITYVSGAASKAVEVAEGAKIPIDDTYFYTKNLDIKKIGTRPLITNEMVEDGLWDLVEWELRKAGQRIENRFNADVMDELASNAAGSAGSSSVNGIFNARADVLKAGWNPIQGVLTPEAEVKVVSGSNLIQAQQAGDTQALREGTIGTIGGIDFNRISVDGDTWTGEKGLVFDPSAYAFIGMRRDLEVEEYNDPIHDLVGISATMRFGTKVIQENAGSTW